MLFIIIVFVAAIALKIWVEKEQPTRVPRFHSALYADSLRQQIKDGQITTEEAHRTMDIIHGVDRGR